MICYSVCVKTAFLWEKLTVWEKLTGHSRSLMASLSNITVDLFLSASDK